MTVNGYLFAAYAVIWTILFVYLFFLHSKQQEVGRQLENLRQSKGQSNPAD